MENGDKNVSRWVTERMARLEPSAGWQPDAEAGLARLRTADRNMRVRRRWGLTAAAGMVLAGSLFVIPGCQAATCKAQSANLAQRLWKSVFDGEDAGRAPARVPVQRSAGSQADAQRDPPVAVVQPPRRQASPSVPASAPLPNFKLTGSPTARILCEIYTDYECSSCARFYSDLVPQLRADYVATGKVKMLHRDYPLSQHKYAHLAARYANAAGIAGQYDVAVQQIFQTQTSWALTGDIESQLAQVLPADVMAKVRALVQSDQHLDDSIEADLAQGRADHLNRTPTIVLVAGGERRLLPFLDYNQLKAALDEVLQRR